MQSTELTSEKYDVVDRAGLAWAPEGFFGEMRPQWTTEPDLNTIAAIARRELRIADAAECSIEFLAKGTFNKVYAIHSEGIDEYIFRVSLPVQPRLKTLSECATMNYIREYTDTPIPRVIASDAQNTNELGFEWTIMERVPGGKLREQWRHMSWLKKQTLVRKVIQYQVQLFETRFDRVANIYSSVLLGNLPSESTPDSILPTHNSRGPAQYHLGPIVSIPFFYHENWTLDIARGPYEHTQEWLRARLQIAAVEIDSQPIYSDDEDEELDEDDEDSIGKSYGIDKKDFEKASSKRGDDEDDVETDPEVLLTAGSKHSRVHRMTDLLPKVFPRDKPEEYMLFHQDLSGNNILVNENHDISGIIDWECVHTVPLWLGCQIPKFLHSEEVTQPPPFKTQFLNDREEQDYWRRIEEYEKTQLRAYFLEEMQRMCPKWMQVHQAGDLKADFEFAVSTVADGATVHFERWLKQVKQGQEPLAFRSAMGHH